VERIHVGKGDSPFRSIADLRMRTNISHEDLRILIKVGALDTIAGGKTRPMMLWEVDIATGRPGRGESGRELPLAASLNSDNLVPRLKEYSQERQHREEYNVLGFTTDTHPMTLFEDRLRRLRLVKSTALSQHVGKTILAAGMLATVKPVHTAKDEPMEFATFDDGAGLIETVLFPDLYHRRGHVLFDQGPFVFQGKVEEEFGALTVTILQLDRLERMLRQETEKA
jgi:DNA polymerase III alpha subunit